MSERMPAITHSNLAAAVDAHKMAPIGDVMTAQRAAGFHSSTCVGLPL